ncbi:hypothetical protein D3C71_2146580 [compost metagenome]
MPDRSGFRIECSQRVITPQSAIAGPKHAIAEVIAEYAPAMTNLISVRTLGVHPDNLPSTY